MDLSEELDGRGRAMNGLVVGAVIAVLIVAGFVLVRVVRKVLSISPSTVAAEPEPKKEEDDEPIVVGLPYMRFIGRRAKCPCKSVWPEGTKRAGQPKAVQSCCGARLARDPAMKGSPLPRGPVEREVARKKALMAASGQR